MEVKVETKKQNVFARIGWAMVVTMIVVNVVQGIFLTIVQLVTGSLTVPTWASFAAIPVGYYCVGFPVFYFMTKSLNNGEKKESEPLTFGKVISRFCMCYSLVYVINLLTNLVITFIGTLRGTTIVNPIADLISNGTWIWALVVVGICSPIVEEFMFRGIMLNKLRVYGDKVAIVTSGLLFGLFHGNFSQFFYATVLGCIFAYVTLKTGKLTCSIILHIMVNMIGSVIGPAAMSNNIALGIFGLCVIALVIAGVVLLIINRKKISFTQGEITLEKGTAFKRVWLNGGMICYTVLCLALMIFILFL